jgi:hypothetical protein
MPAPQASCCEDLARVERIAPRGAATGERFPEELPPLVDKWKRQPKAHELRVAAICPNSYDVQEAANHRRARMTKVSGARDIALSVSARSALLVGISRPTAS